MFKFQKLKLCENCYDDVTKEFCICCEIRLEINNSDNENEILK